MRPCEFSLVRLHTGLQGGIPHARLSLTHFFLPSTRLPHSEPEEARILVPDARHDWLCDLYKPKSRISAYLTCIDIAGLCAGASTGAGLGNAFLSHVRAVDGIFQMVRAFDDAEVIHVEGDVDPCRDMSIIQNELRLKDIEWVEKSLEALKKVSIEAISERRGSPQI